MKKLLLLFTAIAFVSCSSDDNGSKEDSFDAINLTQTEKTLVSKETHRINAVSVAKINYESENEYHAQVSDLGLVTARFVGETNIKLSNGEDTKQFKVVVKPEYNTYPEPNVEFGETKAEVIAKLGKPDTDTSGGISYANYSNASPILMFMFDSDDKLTSYALLVKTTFTSDLAEFLTERYLLVSAENNFYMFINGLTASDATKVVAMQLLNTSYLQVTYIPNNQSVNSKSLQVDLPEFDNALIDLEY